MIFVVSSDIIYILYADDSSILCSNNIIGILCNGINKNFLELQFWFIANKLFLGIEKTNYKIFSNKRIGKSNIFVKNDQKLIKQVMTGKFVGVMIDSHLQWKEHINCVNLKISKCIAIMFIIRDIFTVNKKCVIF